MMTDDPNRKVVYQFTSWEFTYIIIYHYSESLLNYEVILCVDEIETNDGYQFLLSG